MGVPAETLAPIQQPGSSPLVLARAAWAAGDPQRCLDHLAEIVDSSLPQGMRAEARLLRARALHRLRRAADLIEYLEPILASFANGDEACTAVMLYASGVLQKGDAAQAIALLADLALAAASSRAHRAIRAEIAHTRALAHWIARDLDATDRFAHEAEEAHADVISVRAMQLRAFVAVSRRDYPTALRLFRAALDAYRRCREQDALLAETIILQVSSLEVTLRSTKVAGTHAKAEARSSGAALSEPVKKIRMQTAINDAWLFAHDGAAQEAYRKIGEAEDLAPDEAFRAWALAGRALIAYGFGEVFAARDHAERALRLANTVGWETSTGDERIGLLFLVEALARTKPEEAGPIMARYNALTTKIDRSLVMNDDPRLVALEAYVRGLVAKINDDIATARRCFQESHRLYQRIGNRTQAVLVLAELDAIATPEMPRGDIHLEAAVMIVREHFPNSFLARRLGGWLRAYTDPVTRDLSPAQRDVLRGLLEGLSPEEIAEQTGRSAGTVRNHVAALHRAYSVHSTPALMAAAWRSGVTAPGLSTTSSEDELATAVRAS